MILIIELLLRAFNYGVNLDDLFLTTADNQYFYMNKNISKRYFTSSQATTGDIEFFKTTKDSNTVRMFVLGESAALGFPYPNNISFQRMLKYELQKYNPNKNIEIINLSLTAVNSYTFYDIGKDILKFKPDAVLIYGGHNEFYGALGVASTNYLGNKPWLVHFILKLRRSKLVQLLSNFTSSFESSTPPKNDDNLMKYVVKNQSIPYQSKMFQKGISQFEYNMNKLLSIYEKEKTPVFLSSIATNLKDQYPFKSILSEDVDSTLFYTQLKVADEYFHQGYLQKADSLLEYLYKCDSTNGDSQYLWAQVQLELGDRNKSFNLFNESKQRDCLRFRAPDEINNVINNFTTDFSNINFVNAERNFILNSEYNIPGSKLLLEHVHPTIEGHRVITKSFLNSMKDSGLFNDLNMENYTVSDSTLADFPVLEFDSLVGYFACKQLKMGFPFYEISKEKLEFNTPMEKLVREYLYNKNWYTSMESLYKYAVSNNDYALALDVLRVRILDNQYDSNFYTSAGDISSLLNNYSVALAYYEKSFSVFKSFSSAKGAISKALQLDKPETALKYIDYAIINNESNMNFKHLKTLCNDILIYKSEFEKTPSKEITTKIGEIYFEMGNFPVANKYLEFYENVLDN